MLSTAVWFCLIAMLAMLVGQGGYVWLYLRSLQRPAVLAVKGSTFQPPVAVLLCIRGRDPSLEACIKALDQLDWPDFEVFCGFDSEQDEAFGFVTELRASLRRPVHRYVLEHLPKTCSPKCAVLSELVESLHERFEVVAFVDADCIVAPNWLKLLVTPLADPGVGVVSGTRWFEPPAGMAHPLGTTVRAIWNAAAIVQMHLYRIVWGGSMALRRREIDELRLADVWQTQLCEDTCLTGLLSAEGLRVERPPALVVVNNETTPLRSVPDWISRQLLTIRLYNRWWPLVALHGLSVGTLTPLVLATTSVALVSGVLVQSAVMLVSFLAYLLGSLLLLAWIHAANIRFVDADGQLRSRPSIIRDWKFWLMGVPVTQVVHWLATVNALVASSLVWRQVRYRLQGNRIHIESLARYAPDLEPTQNSVH